MDKTSLSDFLSFFEVVAPPFTISEETILHIEEKLPMPAQLVADFIEAWEGESDDFTEYLPLLQLPPQKDYHCVIYWKASLLKYEYVLVTFNEKGLIARKIISAKIIDGDIIKSSVARVEEDLIIYIMAGGTFDAEHYDPLNSQSFSMEIYDDGQVLFSTD